MAEDFIRNQVAWKEGQAYNAALVDETRKKLADTGLFSSLNVEPTGKLDAGGGMPLAINVKERKPRTIKAGVSYSTDEGPGVQASWTNVNVFNHAERLQLNLTISNISDAFESIYTIPDFVLPDQSLKLRGRVGYDTTNAYTSRSALVESTLGYQFSKLLTVGAAPRSRPPKSPRKTRATAPVSTCSTSQ